MSKATTTKVKNTDVALNAMNRATGGRIDYKDEKCDAFVERCINDAGMQPKVNWSGTNYMVRNAMDFTIPLKGDYLADLQPGDLLYIKAPDESGIPGQYRGDGVGDYNHVGIYVGNEYGFYDTDKNGKRRFCNVAHSSSTMGRVAGSSLEKKLVNGGWSHFSRAKCIAYDIGGDDPEPVYEDDAPDMDIAEIPESPAPVTAAPGGQPVQREPGPGEAIINTEESDLRLRKEPKSNGAVIKGMPKGHIVKVLDHYGSWTKVEFVDFRGMKHRGWCATEYLRFG